MSHNKNLVNVIIGFIFLSLSSCGGTGDGNSASGVVNPVNPLSVEAAKVVSISKLMPVPTESGAVKLALRVDNFTGKELSYEGFKAHSQNSEAPEFAARSMTSAGTCTNGLQNQGSCNIEVLPDAKDGSMVVELTFKDVNGQKYTAAQLVSYVSMVDDTSGFGIAANNITIHATNNPTITIPFINKNGYHDIKVIADHPISSYIDCMESIGAKCIATVTLPAARLGTSYLNEISIQGDDESNITYRTSFMASLFGDSSPSIAITAGPSILDASSANKEVNVFIVNTGETSLDLKQVIHSHKDITQWDDGVTTQTDTNSLLTLAHTNGLSFITSKFTLPDEHLAKSGITLYEVSYSVPGSNIIQREYTQIYYKGLNTKNLKHNFIVNPLDFADTLQGTTPTKAIQVKNTGTEALGTPVFTLDNANSHTALSEDTKNAKLNRCSQLLRLESNTFCNIYVTYAAGATASTGPAKVALFNVTAQTLDSTTAVVRRNSIRYKTGAKASPALQVSYPKGNTIAIGTSLNESASLSVQVWNPKTNPRFDLDTITTAVSALPIQSITLTPIVNNTVTNTGLRNPFQALTATSYIIDPAFTTTFESGNLGVINYTYKVSTAGKAESITLAYNVSGRFTEATSFQNTPFNINLSASNDNVKTTVRYLSESKPVGLMLLESFPLTHKTKLQMEVTYSATSQKDNFYVLDSNLPYGFMLNKTTVTTCPTTSNATNARPTGINLGSKQNPSCVAVYDFMPAGLSHQFFYGQAILGTSFVAPGYRYGNATDGYISAQSNSRPVSIKPRKFVPVTATVADDPSTPTNKLVTVEVDNTTSKERPLANSAVFVDAIYPGAVANGTCNVSPKEKKNCLFNVTPVGNSKQLILNVKSGENGEYNTFDEVIKW